jgi:hypothetical protein
LNGDLGIACGKEAGAMAEFIYRAEKATMRAVRVSSAWVNFVAGHGKRLGPALLSAGVVLAASESATPLVRVRRRWTEE